MVYESEDIFIFFLEEVRKRDKFIKLRKYWGGKISQNIEETETFYENQKYSDKAVKWF